MKKSFREENHKKINWVWGDRRIGFGMSLVRKCSLRDVFFRITCSYGKVYLRGRGGPEGDVLTQGSFRKGVVWMLGLF